MTGKPVAALSLVLLLAPPGAADEVADLIKTVIDGTDDNAERAKRLVEAVKVVGDNAKAQTAFCVKAVEFGLKSPDGYKHALAALDMLGQLAPDRMAEWHEHRLTLYRRSYQTSRGSARQAEGRRLMGLLLRAGDAKLARGKAAEAVATYREAMAVAMAMRSPQRPEILAKINAARKKVAIETKLSALLAAVGKNPTDAAARTRLVLFRLLDMDDPAEAGKHLREDVDEFLRTYVPLSARPLGEVEPAACLELGQWYYSLAGEASAAGKLTALTRAMKYHERYLGRTKDGDVKRIKAKVTLGEIVKQLNKLTGSILPTGAVDVLTFDRHTIVRKGETTYARDLSGKGHNAVLVGGKLVRGVAGEAISLDGRREYVNTRFGNKTTPKTVIFWARSNKAGVSGPIFFGHGLMASPGDRFYLGFKAGTGRLSLGLGSSKWGDETTFRADTAWHHYAVVWNGSTMGVYVDARPRGRKKGKTVAGGEYYLGAVQVARGRASYFWAGLIDEFAVFDRVLTSAEIKRLYELGKAGRPLKR